MSYILDALKKSEQQRGHGEVPDVQTIHSSSLNYRSEKKTYWPYVLIVAVILNLAAIVYFMFDKEKPVVIVEATDSKTSKTVQAEFTTETVLPVKTDTVIIEQEKKILQDSRGEPIEKIQTAPSITDTTTGIAASTEREPEKRPATTYKANDDLIEFYELPDSVQLQIPTIIISAHIYSSNPQQRSIVINNKFLEEGDYVIDDLILDEITADGAIFLFEGSRFHYGVVSGWQ